MASLFVILARKSPDAVIFRRGPSKQVLLIKWNRRKDRFEIGQWFKGRIYERRCDLSPSGDLLVYLAAKHKGPIHCWSAVSKPPYLSALALWPNLGTWGGGGLFEDERTLLLNHVDGIGTLADGFKLPKSLKVRPLGRRKSIDELDSIHHERLLRDGWTLAAWGTRQEHWSESGLTWRFAPARAYEKKMERKKVTQVLRMELRAVHEPQNEWYSLHHELTGEDGGSLLKLPRASWADWDSNGDLLFAEDGRLFRLPWSDHHEHGRESAQELADFTPLTFLAKEAPKSARTW